MLFVGRLEPVKNPERFLASRARVPEAQFIVVGDGSLRDRALAASSASTSPSLGARDDARALLARADAAARHLGLRRPVDRGRSRRSRRARRWSRRPSAGCASWRRRADRRDDFDPGGPRGGDPRAAGRSRPADRDGSRRREAGARALFCRCHGRRATIVRYRTLAPTITELSAAQRAPRDPQQAALRRSSPSSCSRSPSAPRSRSSRRRSTRRRRRSR